MPRVCSSSIERAVAAALVLGLALAAAAPASAAPSKVVAALISAAQREFDAGNFARAGELFVAIWKQDASQLPAIYNAARAFQLAGNLDRAEALFREILALPNLDPGLKGKCDDQLGAIAASRGERKAEAAAKAEQDGDFAVAAELWADALRLVPGKPAWRARHGRALQLAGRSDDARDAFLAYRKAAPADDPDRAKVDDWLAQLVPTPPVPAVTSAAPAAAPAVHASAGPGWPAWAVLGVGAAGVIGGGALLALASSQDAALQDDFAKVDGNGLIVGMTPAQASQRAAAIESRYTQGWVVAGVGAAAVGAGVWLLLRKPEASVALLPQGRGAALLGWF